MIVAALVIGGIYLWLRWDRQQTDLQQQINELREGAMPETAGQASATATATPAVTSTPTATLMPTPTPTPDTYAGWETYTNTKYGYRIRYPAGGTVESNCASCVTIRTPNKLGYVAIAAVPPDQLSECMCLRTGVGLCEDGSQPGNAPVMSVTIDSAIYQTTGGILADCPGNKLDYTYNETLYVSLPGDVTMEFGGVAGGKDHPGTGKQDYLNTRPTVIKMVESFGKI
jgi:hypothetical protein